jgi:hypothetical protein
MFQIADRPRAQARRLGQFLLRQPGLGAQLDRVDIGEIGDGGEPLLGEGGRHSVEQRGDLARGVIAADFVHVDTMLLRRLRADSHRTRHPPRPPGRHHRQPGRRVDSAGCLPGR